VQRIGLFGVTNILVSLSSLILLPFLTQNLTISDYAIWTLFITTVGIIPLIITLGLPYSMVRFLATKTEANNIKEEFYSITFILLFVGIITSIILLLLSKQISLIFKGNTTVSTLLALTILASVIFISFSSFFRTFQQMKIISILSLVQTYLMVAIVVFLLESGYKIEGAIFGYLIAQFIVALASIWLVFRQIGFKLPKFKNIPKYLSFGMPTIPGNLSSWIVDASDRYLILFILGTTFVGYYTPAYTLGIIITMFAAPFSFILPALLSKYYDQNEIGEVKKHLDYSIKYFMLLSVPAVFGLSLLSEPLLLVITHKPELAQNGYFITPFVALGALLVGLYGIIVQILILEKKTKIIGSQWMAAAALNVILNIVFIPRFGIIAAAVSTLAAYLFTLAITLIYSQKCIKIEFDFKFLLKSLAASILMSSVILFINPVSAIGILATIIICSAVYIAIIFILRGISREEIEFFKELTHM
jgi:Membrane protein involved in the export of O-antigen and teichoic acid